jgi:Spy/CpxP family protein refolding chaperone
MMSLNKFVTVAFMLVAVSTQVEAQGGGGGGGGGRGGMNPGQMMERQKGLLFKDITLDEAQTKQVDSIMTATQAKQAEMRQAAMGGGGDRQAMMAQMQTLQTEQRTALRAVLKADQQAQFDKNVEAMPAPGAGRRPPSFSYSVR